MATDGNDVSSDEVTDSRCFTCNSMSALKFCVECQGYLCKTCIDYHLLIPVTKGHTLLGKHDNASFTGQAAEFENILQSNGEASISFDVDSSIQTFFRDIKKLGRVNCTIENKRYAVETIRDVNAKIQGDKSTCNIFGSCLLEGGRLLLVDNSNKKLKLVNIETINIVNVCSFDNNPMCVCCTYKDEAVVTFYKSAQFIQFVSIGRELTLSRKVNINHNCWGISYKDDKLYITDNAHTFYIHDMKGNKLQQISTDISENCLFSSVRAVSFSENKRGTIVADWYKGVIILNDQYERIAGYCDAGLQYVTSVCTDDRGNIFVCGCSSQNVLQIGYDGKKIGEVVDKSNGIQHPVSLCFDSNMCRLIVTQSRSNIIKIIQLK